MNVELRKLERVTIFATGTEGYGIRRCLVSMAEGLMSRGIGVHFALSATGRLADVLKQRQWPATFFSDGAPKAVGGSGIGKLIGIGSRGFAQLSAAQEPCPHRARDGQRCDPAV